MHKASPRTLYRGNDSDRYQHGVRLFGWLLSNETNLTAQNDATYL